MLVRVALVAMSLAFGADSLRAASVTYNFIEASVAPHPGAVAAILTFASPPAQSSAGWTGQVTDILSLTVTDAAFAPVGSYTPLSGTAIVSQTGAKLDAGVVSAMFGMATITTGFDATPGGALLLGPGHTAIEYTRDHGDWLLANAAATPEPSTFALSVAGALGFAGYAWRRRKTTG